VVTRDFREYLDQLIPKDVDERIEVFLPPVVLAAVNKLSRETRFEVLAHIFPVVVFVDDTGKLLKQS
jgi:hypothetical protein